MAFGGPRSSCARPGAHSARRLRSLAFLCSSVVGHPFATRLIFFFAANEREWTPMSRKIFGCGLSTLFAARKEFVARPTRRTKPSRRQAPKKRPRIQDLADLKYTPDSAL